MTKIEEIECVVDSLSKEEFRALYDWMSHKETILWDAEIESDIHAGRFANMAEAALAEFRNGKAKPL